ncbi:hypothetical protein J4466_00435 [Candidatus Pacearchaeota archaeon]|nr:hypothetical protein [Candidatus Pacearchaeota archaeon]
MIAKEASKKESRIKIIKDLFKNRFFYISLIVFLIGFVAYLISTMLVYQNFRNAPILNDLLFDALPFIPLPYLYNWLNSLSLIIFSFYVLMKKPKSIPYFLLLFGIFNIVRDFFIILTPFGNPSIFYNGNYSMLSERFEILRFGVYPSGHTGTTFLAFLLTTDKKYKSILLVFVFLVAIFLLLARGHYSIDIFSALIFAYAIYCFGEKYFKKHFVVK